MYNYKFVELSDLTEKKSKILQLALEGLDDIQVKWYTLCTYHEADFHRLHPVDGFTKQGNGDIFVNVYGGKENVLDSLYHEYRHAKLHKQVREEMNYNLLFPNNPKHRRILQVLERDASEYAAKQVQLFKMKHLELFLDNSKKIEL